MGRMRIAVALLMTGLSVWVWPCWGEPADRPDPDGAEATEAPEPEEAEADAKRPFDWREGRIKLEFAAVTGIHSGRRSRTGDIGIRTTVEYEVPALKHLTVGARVMPLLYWNENGDGDNEIFGFGLGNTVRVYSNADEYRGWFGEIGIMIVGQTSRFEGNSGAFNFLTDAGAGYMFKGGWHASAKIQHMSNAGLANKNSGVNGVGFAFGYTFKPDGKLLGRHRRRGDG